MKKIVLLLCVLFPVLMYGQKVAYIYSDSILATVPGYGKNVMKFDSLGKTFEQELGARQTALQQQYDNLIKPYSIKENETLAMLKQRMSVVDTLKLGALLDENAQLQKKRASYDQILQTTYAQDIQPILTRVNAVVSDYASKNGLSAVYSMEQLKGTLIWIDPKQNITKIINAKLKAKPE